MMMIVPTRNAHAKRRSCCKCVNIGEAHEALAIWVQRAKPGRVQVRSRCSRGIGNGSCTHQFGRRLSLYLLSRRVSKIFFHKANLNGLSRSHLVRSLSYSKYNILGINNCRPARNERHGVCWLDDGNHRIVFAVGFGALVIGTMSNNKSRSSCGFTHHHFLSIGGILCFLHALFCVAYYVSATAAKDEAAKWQSDDKDGWTQVGPCTWLYTPMVIV